MENTHFFDNKLKASSFVLKRFPELYFILEGQLNPFIKTMLVILPKKKTTKQIN